MRKSSKRFMSLFIVFATIFSFVPQFGLGGQTVSAVEVEYDKSAVDIQKNELSFNVDVSRNRDGNTTSLSSKYDTIDDINVYSDDVTASTYDISIPNDTWSEDRIQKHIDEISKNYPNDSNKEYSFITVESKKIDIKKINKINVEDLSSTQALADLGITVSEFKKNGKYGVTIDNLPYGANKIQYSILVNYRKTTFVKDNNGNISFNSETVKENASYMTDLSLMINSATKFLNEKIDPLIIDQYIGSRDVDNEQTKYNNSRPLKYTGTVVPDIKAKREEIGLKPTDVESPARYTTDLFDSATALDYTMTYDGVLKGNAIVYVNGTRDDKVSTDIDSSEQKSKISGNVQNVNENQNFIMVKLPTDDDSIEKMYCFELRFNLSNTDKDYSIKKANVTKQEGQHDSSISAYIGKKYEIIDEKNPDDEVNFLGETNVKVYKGEITIDKAAEKVSINPDLVTSQKVIYRLSSEYTDENGILQKDNNPTTGKDDGLQYISFHSGGKVILRVYEDSTGDGETLGPLLARYEFAVKDPESPAEVFDINLKFDNNTDSNTYLTQQGVGEEKISFNKNRYDYNLYTSRAESVNISLDASCRTSRHEYIRVWIADSLSGTYYEAEESKENTFNSESGQREYGLDIEFGKAKKIKVQAYYDDVSYDQNTGKYVNNGSYKIGSSYQFYLINNFDSSTDDDSSKSKDAYLSNIKIKGQTLYDLDGNKGFKSDVFDYKVTVPKGQENAVITVVPQDDNVKSIVATVEGTDTSYELTSGEENELMLNSNGTTELNILVTAQDGKTTATYTVTIINSTKGASSKLKDLILSSGDFKFDPDDYTTKVQVEQNVNSISITPIAEDTKAKITVDGQKFTGKPIRVSLAGKQTTEVDIEVESEDGESTTTYTLKIKRVSTISDDDSDNNEGITEDIYYDYDNECWVDTTKYDEWGTINNRVMYFDKKGRQVKDRWICTGRKWYYINEAGYRATGWKVDSETGQRYYMDNVTGEMKLGWMYLNGSWYYLGTTGVMHTGWLWLDNNWYYFTENGEMVANQSMFIDGKMYRFATDGRIY